MKKKWICLFAALLIAAGLFMMPALAEGEEPVDTPTPTPMPTPTATPTPAATPAPTVTHAPTATPVPTVSPTATAGIAVTGVTVTPSTLTLLVDATYSLRGQVLPANASNQGITWSSSAPLVASVSTGGMITGNSAGTAVITATSADGNKSAVCTVTVSASYPTVSNFQITGAVFPSDGMVYSATMMDLSVPAGANYELVSSGWQNVTDGVSMHYGDTFTATKTYMLSVSVAPKEGYTVKLPATGTVGGKSITKAVTYSYSGGRNAAELQVVYEIARISTVTFDANGGSMTPKTAQTSSDGKLVSLPSPVLQGSAFDGWWTAKVGGTKVNANTIFNKDTTIYAHWKPSAVYTITFNPNGGTVTPKTKLTSDDSRLTVLPKPKLEGSTFDGWYTKQTGGTKVTANTVFSKNTTIYAHWKPEDILTTEQPDTDQPNGTGFSDMEQPTENPDSLLAVGADEELVPEDQPTDGLIEITPMPYDTGSMMPMVKNKTVDVVLWAAIVLLACALAFAGYQVIRGKPGPRHRYRR